MRYLNKTFISRLLVLIMVISSIQSAVAIDFNQNMHEENNQEMQLQFSNIHNMEIGSNYLVDHGEENLSHSDCAAQCFVSYVQDPHVILLVTRSSIQQKILIDSSAFSSRYPNLLKRPPRA